MKVTPESNTKFNIVKRFVPLLLFIFITSCMSTINLDGKPIPGHMYVQRNPATNIKTKFLFVRYIEKTEGEEKFLYPAYMELNKDVIIPSDTKNVYIILEVINILKVSYTLVKKFKVWDGTPYPYNVNQVVSISKQPNRVHQISLPYKKGIKVDFGLQLFDDKGNFLMDIGQAKYTVKGGDTK